MPGCGSAFRGHGSLIVGRRDRCGRHDGRCGRCRVQRRCGRHSVPGPGFPSAVSVVDREPRMSGRPAGGMMATWPAATRTTSRSCCARQNRPWAAGRLRCQREGGDRAARPARLRPQETAVVVSSGSPPHRVRRRPRSSSSPPNNSLEWLFRSTPAGTGGPFQLTGCLRSTRATAPRTGVPNDSAEITQR